MIIGRHLLTKVHSTVGVICSEAAAVFVIRLTGHIVAEKIFLEVCSCMVAQTENQTSRHTCYLMSSPNVDLAHAGA